MKKGRREFLKLLGATAISAVLPKETVNVDKPAEIEGHLEYTPHIFPSTPFLKREWQYSNPFTCPECGRLTSLYCPDPRMVGTTWDHGKDLEWDVLTSEPATVFAIGPDVKVATSKDMGITWVLYEKA